MCVLAQHARTGGAITAYESGRRRMDRRSEHVVEPGLAGDAAGSELRARFCPLDEFEPLSAHRCPVRFRALPHLQRARGRRVAVTAQAENPLDTDSCRGTVPMQPPMSTLLI